jgi:PEGA domain-containing protein
VASTRLLALVALLALACRREPPAAEAPRAAGPWARPVTVESAPPGARVVVDGAVRGSTPCTFRLDPGRHRLALRMPQYLPYETDVQVGFEGEVRVSATLIASH